MQQIHEGKPLYVGVDTVAYDFGINRAKAYANHGETHYGRKWNQLYFRRGRSVLSRPVSSGRDRVSDWKVWNVEKNLLERASERIISGAGTCWKVK